MRGIAFPLIVSIFIAQAAGIIGSAFSRPNITTWYPELIKPEINPPSWVFAPVWITLFTLIGIAAYLVWQNRKEATSKIALQVYWAQLVLNVLWSIFFFGMRNPMLAFIDIIFLLAFIMLTTILFWMENKWAGILFLPYLVWVTFATHLNYLIWQLN